MTSLPVEPDLLARGGVRLEVDGPVVTVTLDRPEHRNAQTPATWGALAAVGAGVTDEVRVVILRGEGSSFSAGLDRRMLSPEGVPGEESLFALLALDDEAMLDRIDAYQQGFTWLRDPRFVSIAAVQGYAIGAGFQLALACDLRVLAADAQLSMKETALGLVPDLTGTKPLVEAVGYSRALEICATARFVGGAEAQEIGLSTAVVASSELTATVADLAAALCEPLAGAVRGTKALLQSAATLDLDAQRRAERTAQVARFRELASLSGG